MDSNKTKLLDLGCGQEITKIKRKVDEYYGVDIIESDNPNIKKCDLFVEKIPFDDNTFDYVTAFDFLEHVPRVVYYKDKLHHPFIHVMNEVYRILKKDGILIIHSPVLNENFYFYMDPTHVNPISDFLFRTYFVTIGEKNPNTPWAKSYGFNGNFELLYSGIIKQENFKIDFETCIIQLKKIDRVSSEV